MDSQRRVQPSALHLSPGFHRRDLPPLVLATVLGTSQTGNSGTCEFMVGTPEVRCRLKGLLRWVPAAGNVLSAPEDYYFLQGGMPFSRFGASTLWLAKRDDVDMGGRGLRPVENLLGDIFGPVPIPDPGCMGFLFEAETAAPEIWGRLTIDCSGSPGDGAWVLSVAADAVHPMTEEEWARVNSRMYLRGGGLLLANPGRPS